MNVKNKRNCVLCYRMPNTKQWRIMCPAKSGTWVSLQDCTHAAKLGTHASLEDGKHPVEAEPFTSHGLYHWWTRWRTMHTCLPAWLCILCKANPVPMPAYMLCTLFRNRNRYHCWSEKKHHQTTAPELNSDSSIHKNWNKFIPKVPESSVCMPHPGFSLRDPT